MNKLFIATRHTIHVVAMLLVLTLTGVGAAHASESDKDAHIHVYKSPTCGCCVKWVDHLTEAGFTVTTEDRDDMMSVKQELGVPAGMGSCHTATVAGYTIEGHVPAEDIKRLLSEKPAAKGLAVPGMPIGSPGMEMGDRRDKFSTILFSEERKAEEFASH